MSVFGCVRMCVCVIVACGCVFYIKSGQERKALCLAEMDSSLH